MRGPIIAMRALLRGFACRGNNCNEKGEKNHRKKGTIKDTFWNERIKTQKVVCLSTFNCVKLLYPAKVLFFNETPQMKRGQK